MENMTWSTLELTMVVKYRSLRHLYERNSAAGNKEAADMAFYAMEGIRACAVGAMETERYNAFMAACNQETER